MKDKFCDLAKREFNDSYSALLSYLLEKNDDYDKLLNFNAPLKLLFQMLTELNNEVERLKKELEGKRK